MAGKVIGAKEAAEFAASHQNILIFSHYNPDADAYGSSCGLGLALREAGKKIAFVNESGSLNKFHFIPGVSEVVAEIPAGSWDAVIICDCGDIKRVGDGLMPKLNGLGPILSIDHHNKNPLFGDLNYVDDRASSTAEMVLELLRAGGFKISKDSASALYAGISGDTGSFRYASTSASVFGAAKELVLAGASPYQIGQALHGDLSASAVRLESMAMSTMNLHSDGRVAEVVITEDMYAKTGSSSLEADFLVEKARDIVGVLVSLVIRRDGDLWRISMRSRDPKYDVSSVASDFGGGGHKVAAAFRWRSSLEDLRSKLVPALIKLVQS